MNYVIDTNIVTALMRNDVRIKAKLQEMVIRGKEVFISAVSYYEVKRGLLAANAKGRLGVFHQMCGQLGILFLDNLEIFERASQIYADLRRRGKPIPDADILIAATALTQNLIVVSDDSHFERIRNIILENWLAGE